MPLTELLSKDFSTHSRSKAQRSIRYIKKYKLLNKLRREQKIFLKNFGEKSLYLTNSLKCELDIKA
jgi:hypothetical protein